MTAAHSSGDSLSPVSSGRTPLMAGYEMNEKM